MTEENLAFRQEGDPAFPTKENENSASSPEEKTKTEDTQSDEGDDTQPKKDEKDIPFHEHPRWKEREENWTNRFNEQETRHQDDLKALREEFGDMRKANAEQLNIPSWFGGTEEEWKAYKQDEDNKLKQAEERAIERINKTREKEDKAVKEATDYMQSEINTIQDDKTINPDGAKVDPNKLLKFVLDNDLVDSKGRWNYRAGFQMMKTKSDKTDIKNKKAIAGATTSEDKAETKPPTYATPNDFKKNRPW